MTLTGLTYAAITQDNILGIINETQSEPLYTPMDLGNITNVTYSSGTLTITLASTVKQIEAGDKLFVKLLVDDDYAKQGTDPTATLTAVIAALAETGKTDDIKKIIRDAIGACAEADQESELGIQVGNFMLGYYNDGEWYIDTDHESEMDDLEVGTVVKVTALPTNDEYHVPASVDTSNLWVDNEDNQIHGITGEPILVQVGHCYKVTGIYQATFGDWVIYTYEEITESVTDLIETNTEKILTAIRNINFSALAKETSVSYNIQQVGNMQGYLQNTIAKEATIGTANDAETALTVFGKLAKIYEYLAGRTPEDIPEGLGDRINLLLQFFGLPDALPGSYQALTPADAIAIARDCQYNVMGTDWPIPTWLPTGVTEAQVESAAEGLGIPYHEPTQTA